MSAMSSMSAAARRTMRDRSHGFTLMEMLITVAIIALIAAIAIPNYTQYITRSNRSDARAQLLEAAAFLQRCFTQNNNYTCALPGTLVQAPATGTAKYTIAVANPGGNATFTLTATPTGSMTGDACGNLTVTHTGERARTGTAPVDLCWAR
jgi:type IV pilus assembly protein PilE